MNVEHSRRMSRDEAISLVQCLLTGDTADEAQASELLTALERGLRCPHISDYIFWDFDPSLPRRRSSTEPWRTSPSLFEVCRVSIEALRRGMPDHRPR